MTPKSTTDSTFSKEERDAMRAAAAERKAAKLGADGEAALREAIDKLAPADQSLARAIDAIIRSAAPSLVGKTWYGMPAYALDGKVVVFFQSGEKFKTRYCTLGFTEHAKLDDGLLWPTSFAVAGLDAAVEARVRELVVRAVS